MQGDALHDSIPPERGIVLNVKMAKLNTTGGC